MALLICMKQLAPTRNFRVFFQDPKDKQVVFLFTPFFRPNRPKHPQVDWWALGVLTFELLFLGFTQKTAGPRGFQSTFPKFPKKT